MDILGFNPSLLHSIGPVFGGVPTIRFKLKEQINLDDLTSVEYFKLERKVNLSWTNVISCRIMGIRGLQATPKYDWTSNDLRWVKIDNCEYTLEQEEILQWLRLYGQPLSLLGEEMLPDLDSDAGPLGNGTYSLKMKLTKDIPQFLPMDGIKIWIYFKTWTNYAPITMAATHGVNVQMKGYHGLSMLATSWRPTLTSRRTTTESGGTWWTTNSQDTLANRRMSPWRSISPRHRRAKHKEKSHQYLL